MSPIEQTHDEVVAEAATKGDGGIAHYMRGLMDRFREAFNNNDWKLARDLAETAHARVDRTVEALTPKPAAAEKE